MAELCDVTRSEPIRKMGILRERMGKAKRESLDLSMEKSDFTTKVLNGGQGVMLDDIPLLLMHLRLKMVDVEKVCVDRDLAQAYETIARHVSLSRSLLFEDAE